jgi:hypothetical protein
MTDRQCPWCLGINLRLTRQDAQATEYRCYDCGEFHSLRPDDPNAYAFYPADVAAAFDNDLEPLYA